MRLSFRESDPRCAFALHRRVVLLGLVATVCFQVPAAAEDAIAVQREADEQFEQGKQALKRGDWAAACERFRRSLQLDATPSSHVKVARCHEHEGALRLAWGEYEQAIEKLRSRSTTDRHARELRDLVTSAQSALAKKLGTLRVSFSQVVEAGIVIDGRPVTPEVAHAGILIEPGEHRVEASVTNYLIEPVLVRIAAGEQRTVRIELGAPRNTAVSQSIASAPLAQTPQQLPATPSPVASIGAQAPHRMPGAQARNSALNLTRPKRIEVARHTDAASAPNEQLSSGRAQRWVGMAASGLGLAFYGAAGYLGIRTQARVREARENGHCSADYWCDSEGMARLDQAEQLQTQALVFTVAGTLLGATGIVLWATAPARRTGDSGSASKLGIRVSPWGSSVGGQF